MTTTDNEHINTVVSEMLAEPGAYRDSRTNPCPVCGHTGGWCLISNDRNIVICGKQDVGAQRKCGEAGWLHVLSNPVQDLRPTPSPRVAKPKPSGVTPTRNWRNIVLWYVSIGKQKRNKLAEQLGVSPDSLGVLGVGYDFEGSYLDENGQIVKEPCWTFPERNGTGEIIGINRRFTSGCKKRMKGSKSGLTYKKAWDENSGPIYLVEGGSDVAAMLTMQMTAIGRPSNVGGVKLLTELLSSVATDREIIVIGERDEKADGKWPGRDGAISTAEQLADSLDRPVSWALPPEGSKDVRAWLQTQTAPSSCAEEFHTSLEMKTVRPSTVHIPPKPSKKAVDIDSWRAELLQARLESFEKPGVYLDRSPTGAGKSYADQEAIKRWIDEL